MKLLHQVGHNGKWNLDAYFQQNIGDGFIFCAYNYPNDSFEKNISSYSNKKYLPVATLDLQFYGNKSSEGLGRFDTYSFHPALSTTTEETSVEIPKKVQRAIEFQEKMGVKKIIIPQVFYDTTDIDKSLALLASINNFLSKGKKNSHKYYMTLPFSNRAIHDDDYIEKILLRASDMDVCFDGYYVVCDAAPAFRKKVSDDYEYYANLAKVLGTLKKHNFEVIHGYANWDSLIFTALINLDYVTIGTYEVLRNFSPTRYKEKKSGGPSDGWYFSEKLLNFVRAKDLIMLRKRGFLDAISNSHNVFSDAILQAGYVWNTHKPDIHKNYLLAISRLLNELSQEPDIGSRVNSMTKKVKQARQLYADLASNKVFLEDESGDYFLSTWLNVLQQNSHSV